MKHARTAVVVFALVGCGASDPSPPAAKSRAITDLAPPVALPGNCIPVPATTIALVEHRSTHGYDRYQERQLDEEKDISWRFETLHDIDIDLDGTMDARVPVAVRGDGTCPTEIEWELYVVRGECGHFVGRVAGIPKGPDNEPMGEIWAHEEPQGPQDTAVTRTYAFKGGAVYGETTKEVHTSRCEVHPADCQPMTRFECRLVPHADSPTP